MPEQDATVSLSPDPSLTHLGRFPSGTGRVDAPPLDLVTIARRYKFKPYGPTTAPVRCRSRATREFLFGPDVPPIAPTPPRRQRQRASRRGRVQARKATKATADPDGEPPEHPPRFLRKLLWVLQ